MPQGSQRPPRRRRRRRLPRSHRHRPTMLGCRRTGAGRTGASRTGADRRGPGCRGPGCRRFGRDSAAPPSRAGGHGKRVAGPAPPTIRAAAALSTEAAPPGINRRRFLKSVPGRWMMPFLPPVRGFRSVADGAAGRRADELAVLGQHTAGVARRGRVKPALRASNSAGPTTTSSVPLATSSRIRSPSRRKADRLRRPPPPGRRGPRTGRWCRREAAVGEQQDVAQPGALMAPVMASIRACPDRPWGPRSGITTTSPLVMVPSRGRPSRRAHRRKPLRCLRTRWNRSRPIDHRALRRERAVQDGDPAGGWIRLSARSTLPSGSGGSM